MIAPIFTRVAGTALYWSDDAASARRVAFVGHAEAGDVLTLAQSWSDALGFYAVFAVAAPDDGADGARAKALLTLARWRGWPLLSPRLLWIDNAAVPGTTDPFLLTVIAAIDIDLVEGSRLRRGLDVPLGGYHASLPAGAVVGLATDGSGLSVGGTPVLASPCTLFPGRTGASIPLVGTAPGALKFTMPLTAPGGPGTASDFERLAVGLCYARPSDDGLGGIDLLRLPVLVQPATPLELYASIDPLAPLDPAATRFSFFADTAPQPAAAMLSTFATARGHPVRLQPSRLGERPAGLVFALEPRSAGSPGEVSTDFYLTVDGHFDVSAAPGEAAIEARADGTQIERLVCGTAGLEYLAFPRSGGTPPDDGQRLVFIPGKPSYAAPADPDDPDAPRLTTSATTAWAYVWTGGAPAAYYSQPAEAPLFSSADGDFITFFEAPAMLLPTWDGTQAFPIAPYRGIAADDAALARALEAEAIAPERHARIAALIGPASSGVEAQVGVTPQGMAVGLSTDPVPRWAWIGIAKQDSGDGPPDLRFTDVTGPFRQALQANRQFLILGDAATVMAAASVPYCLTAQAIASLRADPQGVPIATIQAAATIAGQRWPTEAAFDDALAAAVGQPLPVDQLLVFQRAAGQLLATVEDWTFQLSPRNWYNPKRVRGQHAFMVSKLTRGRTLRQYASDPGSWIWPEAAARTLGEAAAALAAFVAETQTAYDIGGGSASPYAFFVEQVLDDPDWCGTLFLRPDVPLTSLPQPLRPLQAGIDPKSFFAHHIGFNLTPFLAESGTLKFRRTSMFGLIDYNDPADLLLDRSIPFGFKVLRLAVGFRNSRISYFSSQIELMANQLFGQPARLWPTTRGNNMILNGTYQHQKGPDGLDHPVYLFASRDDGVYQISDSALTSVEIASVSLITEPPAADQPSRVAGVFQLGGRLRFWDSGGFDPFSYGPVAPIQDAAAMPTAFGLFGETLPLDDTEPEWVETPMGLAEVVSGSTIHPGEQRPSREERLRAHADRQAEKASLADGYLAFSGLAVSMTFDMYLPTPDFTFQTRGVVLDPGASLARDNALANRFPARPRRLVASPAAADGGSTDPKDLGYASISATGLEQSLMTTPWFGIEYELPLGGLGALAANAAFSIKVLAAWSGGGSGDKPAVYFGMLLPGSGGGTAMDLGLQGVLTLGFRSIEFDTYALPDPALPVVPGLPPPLGYLIRFRNFGLHALGIAFPPGQNDIYLFGNPDQTSATTLGWYAAYAGAEDKKKAPKRAARALLATRRAPDVGTVS